LPKPLCVPEHLQPLVDQLVQCAHSGDHMPTGHAFDLVTSWCEAADDGVAVFGGDHGTSFYIVHLQAALSRLDRDTLEFMAKVDDDEPLDDALCAKIVRRHLCNLLGEGDLVEDLSSTGCEILAQATDGTQASLCFLMSGGFDVFTGPDIEWEGVFVSLEQFRKRFSGDGALTQLADLDGISDQALLAAWRAAQGE
jgi:hypothetical protein